MEEEKELEKKIKDAFQKTTKYLPEDRYFKKIWHSIECRAPVGEKYYLRSFFSMFFIFLLFVIFILFYTDFLSSVLTLKNIRKENLKFYSTSYPMLNSRTKDLKPAVKFEVSNGIQISAVKDSRIQMIKLDLHTVELDFFSGHVIVNKATPDKSLIINLPDMKLKIIQGRCNLFCYDNIIRIISLSHTIEIEYNGKKQKVEPGFSFYLLDRKGVKR